jgi:hypothetical protein
MTFPLGNRVPEKLNGGLPAPPIVELLMVLEGLLGSNSVKLKVLYGIQTTLPFGKRMPPRNASDVEIKGPRLMVFK